MDRALEILKAAPPDVMNHNLETAPRLYKEARPGSDYAFSLNLLKRFKEFAPHVPTKSGLMVGLGETDEEILQAYSMSTTLEGIFAEPASTAPIAGLRKLAAAGFFDKAPVSVVATLTGHGLKDPDRAIKCAPSMINIPATIDAVVGALKL